MRPSDFGMALDRLAVTLEAGEFSPTSIRSAAAQCRLQKTARWLESVARALEQGQEPGAALLAGAPVDESLRGLVLALPSGGLSDALTLLAAEDVRRAKHRAQTRKALAGPLFSIVAITALLGLIAWRVIPKLLEHSAVFDLTILPGVLGTVAASAARLGSLGTAIVCASPLILLGSLAAIAVRLGAVGKLPLIGPVWHYLRATRTLATMRVLLNSGADYHRVLSPPLTPGVSTSDQLQERGFLPAPVAVVLALTESAGDLDTALHDAIATADDGLELALGRAILWSHILLTVAAGAVVLLGGTVVIAFFHASTEALAQ